jgi:hypothetical protein
MSPGRIASPEKISQSLAESLQGADAQDWIDLIVELEQPRAAELPGSSRAEKIAALKEDFARRAEPVAERIRRMGGEVTGQAWINSSLRARVAKKMVAGLSDEAHVIRLDLPHLIQAESK